jgi:Ser/Thr protein kinase RdoA (MazF antagonist)
MHHVLTSCLKRGVALGCLTEAERELGRRALTRVNMFANERPTACHRDYSPRNWLLTPEGLWSGVLDFEHARWDVRAADISHWWDLYNIEHPERGEAFLAGYGDTLTPDFVVQIVFARIMNALCRIVWATQHNDYPFEIAARQAITRINCALDTYGWTGTTALLL